MRLQPRRAIRRVANSMNTPARSSGSEAGSGTGTTGGDAGGTTGGDAGGTSSGVFRTTGRHDRRHRNEQSGRHDADRRGADDRSSRRIGQRDARECGITERTNDTPVGCRRHGHHRCHPDLMTTAGQLGHRWLLRGEHRQRRSGPDRYNGSRNRRHNRMAENDTTASLRTANDPHTKPSYGLS